MISQHQDPATMSHDARLAELANILALGYLRLLKSRDESQNCLDGLAESTAPCVSTVSGGRAARKETA